MSVSGFVNMHSFNSFLANAIHSLVKELIGFGQQIADQNHSCKFRKLRTGFILYMYTQMCCVYSFHIKTLLPKFYLNDIDD